MGGRYQTCLAGVGGVTSACVRVLLRFVPSSATQSILHVLMDFFRNIRRKTSWQLFFFTCQSRFFYFFFMIVELLSKIFSVRKLGFFFHYRAPVSCVPL